MNSQVAEVARQYAAVLHRYLGREQETLLQQAYELGREAIAGGLGVLDMARIHQQALATCVLPALSTGQKTRVLKAAGTFFMEILSPFEATHRGFHQANQRLHQLNDA